jgi:hypothetical protein
LKWCLDTASATRTQIRARIKMTDFTGVHFGELQMMTRNPRTMTKLHESHGNTF